MMRNLIVGALLLFALSATRQLPAQDSVLAEMYGQGVHAFNAYQYQETDSLLTSVIDAGTQDPRVYYFRGLTRNRLGMQQAAEEDFSKGAELEAAGSDRVYPVGMSLQRVQGSDRILLEQHRRTARLAHRTEINKAKQARYEELRRSEEQVVRDPNRQPPAAQPRELVGEPPASDATDPFTTGAPQPQSAPAQPAAAEAVTTPKTGAAPSAAATPAPAPEADPFGASTPAPAPAADPFGAGAADPFGAGTPAPAPAADPFGAGAADPFGAGTPAPAPAADPAADPFGDGNAADPFGAEAPAESPAPAADPFGDDPFGN